MKFPYGICNYYDLITEDYLYIDRTGRIRDIENAGKQLLFLRPRRFGKSLLLSMLENYYDIAKADEFEQLFGHLAIGKNPTPLHNRYLVMNWDFSTVSSGGEPHELNQALHNHINGCIEQFRERYKDILNYDMYIDPQDALRSFQSVLASLQRISYRMYLLIDEYDNFANEVLMSDPSVSPERYKSLLYGEGALKTVFKAVKSAAKGMGLDRVFITGVSPVVLSDVTSGYNIAENISFEPQFNDLCGFNVSETESLLRRTADICSFSEEQTAEATEMIRAFYNGYLFSSDAKDYICNPTLVLYFMKHFQNTCRYPANMLDSNLAMDKNKIRYISKLAHGNEIIALAVNEDQPLSVTVIGDRFGVEDILKSVKDSTFMISLLYYFGILTLTGGRTSLGKLMFRIPNMVIRKLYAEQIRDMLVPDFRSRDDAQAAAEQFYKTGDLQPLCDFIEQKYFKVFDNRDYRWANELTVKTVFLTLLFNDALYIMDSEPALERSYADLTMIVRPDMRRYEALDFLIEFKYVSLSEAGLSGEKIRQMSGEELLNLPSVQKKLNEAQDKLNSYRRILEQAYGATLRLRVYAVAAVGFERIVRVSTE